MGLGRESERCFPALNAHVLPLLHICHQRNAGEKGRVRGRGSVGQGEFGVGQGNCRARGTWGRAGGLWGRGSLELSGGSLGPGECGVGQEDCGMGLWDEGGVWVGEDGAVGEGRGRCSLVLRTTIFK